MRKNVKKRIFKLGLEALLAIFVVLMIITIVQLKVDISNAQQTLSDVNASITEQLLENEALSQKNQ